MAINDVEHCETCEIHEDKIKQVSEHMPDEDELYDLAELFKIFGDSTRIRILYVLFESEVCVCDLAEMLHMNQSAISHQLRSKNGRCDQKNPGCQRCKRKLYDTENEH